MAVFVQMQLTLNSVSFICSFVFYNPLLFFYFFKEILLALKWV